jgi:hypothetical protein
MTDVAVTTLARLFGTNGLFHTLSEVTVELETDVASGVETVRIFGCEDKQKLADSGPEPYVTRDGGIQLDLDTAEDLVTALTTLLGL